jgi:predicted dehydrogenase
MGQKRLEHYTDDPRSRVVAACARDEARLRQAVADEAIRLETDPQRVYDSDDVDAVVLCLCNAQHYEHVKAALEAGKHVHCEYPLTDSLEQYDELVALAQAKGAVLHHGLTVRAESLHRTMKDALSMLGQPRAAHYRYYGGSKWYVQPKLRGDLFCALHIHFIEQFVDFFGQPEKMVAHGIERDGKVSAVATMHFPDGLVGTIEFAMGFTDKPGYMGTVVTTDGWCGFSTDPDMQVIVERAGQRETITPPPDTSMAEDARSFLDEILGTGGPQSDLSAGRNVLALCLECSRQMRE